MSKSTPYRWRFIRLRSTTGEMNADPTLRARLVADAIATRSSLTAVALDILAETYQVPYEPTGRVGRAADDGDVLMLRVPLDLDRAIAMRAAEHQRRSVQAEIVSALSAHYGLAVPESKRSVEASRAA